MKIFRLIAVSLLSGPLFAQVGNPPVSVSGLASLNGALYASQCSGADAEKKIAACVALLPSAGGTIIVDFVGAQTWGATLTLANNVEYLFQNCAIYDATSLTGSPFLSTTASSGNWRFVGAIGGGNQGNGCTQFKVANTSAQNINLVDQENFELGYFSILKTSGTLGDAIDGAYIQYSNIHDLAIYPIITGAKWVDGIHINTDANGSSIYNTFTRILVGPFSISVGGVTTNCLHLTGGTGGKVLNQNTFLQITCTVHPGATGLLIDGGTGQANENRLTGDFSNNATCWTLATNSTRDLDMSNSTCENSSGTAFTNNTGNTFFRCSNCEIAGNNSQGTFSGADFPYFQGNVQNGGASQVIGTLPQGDILINGLCAGAVTFTDANCASAFNLPANWVFQNAGTSLAQITAAGWVALKPIDFNEATAPAGIAGEDVLYGDSTSHTLKASYNNGSFFNVPLTIANGTSTMTAGAVTAATCQTAITTTATSTATTDSIEWAYATAPTLTTDALLAIAPYVTSGNVNFTRCNPTAASITGTAIVINWRVIR